MSHTPRLVGTLIVVVLKAKNLPNKRHIGKQDPYCVLKLANETRRTKAVKRGGQHPEWDEEIRFELFEDIEDELARTAGAGSPPPPPPKDETNQRSRSKERKIRGGKTMNVSCYADDLREPELIGETTVDLTEALTKGETDEWFTLTTKDKYCGEVYLELTFWSNEKEPEKRTTPRPSTLHPQYGGPGSFKPSNPGDIPASLQTGHGSAGSSPSGGKMLALHDRHSSSPVSGVFPDSLRPSSSLAKLDLYVPAYETKTLDVLSASHVSRPASVSEFGVHGAVRRRDSFPSFQVATGSFGFGGYPYSPTSIADGMNTLSLNDPYGAPPANSGFHPQLNPFGGALYQPLPPSGGFGPPQPSATPIPSGFQPMYTGFVPPRSGPTPMPGPGFIQPPPSAMGFHQPYPPQPNAPLPPFHQHHSFPGAAPTHAPSTFGPLPPLVGAPQPQYAPAPTPAPYAANVPQQSSGFQVTGAPCGGRPLPDQPRLTGFAPVSTQSPIAFPNTPVQYHPNPAPTPVPIPPVAPAFVAPGPPPPLQHQRNSLPPAPAQGHIQQQPMVQGSSTHQVTPSAYHPNAPPPLPVPPQQQQIAQNSQTPSYAQNGTYTYAQSGFSPGAPNATNSLPPLPNPPPHPNFPLSQSPQQIRTQLPGPPPPLPKKGNIGSNPLPAPPPLQPWLQRPPSASEQMQQRLVSPSTNGSQPMYPPPPTVQGNW